MESNKYFNAQKTGATSAINTPPDSLNDNFLSLPSRLLQSLMGNSDLDGYVCTFSLLDFCMERRGPSRAFHILLLNVYEVGRLITDLKSKKYMGLDNIPARLLKLALPYIVEPLTDIYNVCIQKSVFPNMFKTAKAVPFPKNTDRSDSNNFWPISLLYVLSKPLERHAHNHLSNFMENHSLFHHLHLLDLGHNTRVTLLCLHCVTCCYLLLCDMWISAVDRSEIVGAVFLDYKKVFDLVDHTILRQKLQVYLNNPSVIPFLQSYLSDRSQYVCVNGKLSAVGAIQTGVPQGSILGPLPFCIFIKDPPLHTQGKKVRNSLFADDSSLDTSGKTLKEIEVRLQKIITEVSDWYEKNRMCLYPEKTKCMVITTRQKHQRSPLCLQDLPFVSNLRKIPKQ